jgi:hypothetical protein
MLRHVKMFRGVLVLGRVAATHVAAGEAHPQVHPGVSDLQAIFTATGTRFDVANFLYVFALAHLFSPITVPTSQNGLIAENLQVFAARQ